MARLTPITTSEVKDEYLADKIYGFPTAPAMLMISVGKVSTQPKRAFSARRRQVTTRHRSSTLDPSSRLILVPPY
jgi:hypothetical protein